MNGQGNDLERMRVLDYEAAGRKVAQWAKDPSSRPRNGDIAEFRRQLEGIVEIPARFTDVRFEQGDDHLFIMRLPPAREASESERRVTSDAQNAPGIQSYNPPYFYMDMLCGERNFNNLEFWYSRIGDYTLTQCG